ncbi:MAG TPA: hypothetical protein VN708_07045 [Terriglobales bacterium]|nr:hypothetical protein [Terriglobales bacterium]
MQRTIAKKNFLAESLELKPPDLIVIFAVNDRKLCLRHHRLGVTRPPETPGE